MAPVGCSHGGTCCGTDLRLGKVGALGCSSGEPYSSDDEDVGATIAKGLGLLRKLEGFLAAQ